MNRKVWNNLPVWFYWGGRKLRGDEFCDSYVLISYLFRLIALTTTSSTIFFERNKNKCGIIGMNNWFLLSLSLLQTPTGMAFSIIYFTDEPNGTFYLSLISVLLWANKGGPSDKVSTHDPSQVITHFKCYFDVIFRRYRDPRETDCVNPIFQVINRGKLHQIYRRSIQIRRLYHFSIKLSLSLRYTVSPGSFCQSQHRAYF